MLDRFVQDIYRLYDFIIKIQILQKCKMISYNDRHYHKIYIHVLCDYHELHCASVFVEI